jgi:hypothetical protein
VSENLEDLNSELFEKLDAFAAENCTAEELWLAVKAHCLKRSQVKQAKKETTGPVADAVESVRSAIPALERSRAVMEMLLTALIPQESKSRIRPLSVKVTEHLEGIRSALAAFDGVTPQAEFSSVRRGVSTLH